MPSLPKSDWTSAAQFEARKYVPFKMESLIWDCNVKPAAEKSASTGETLLEVVFIGIPREAFTKFQAALKEAGLEADSIEPISVSLSRLVTEGASESGHEFMCLVDVSQGHAHLVIARNGLPYLTRDVHLANGAAAPAPGPEGLALQGAAPESNQPVQRLLSELSVSIDFFKREYTAATITRVILFGDEPALGQWTPMIAAHLPCPVELGQPHLQRVVEGEASLALAAGAGVLCSAAAPHHGAALDLLRRSAEEPSRHASSASASVTSVAGLRSLAQSPQTIGTALATAGVMTAVLWVMGTMEVSNQQRQMTQLQKAKAPIPKMLESMDQNALKPLQEQAKEQLRVLKGVIGQRTLVSKRLDELARSLPDGIWLTGLSLENKLTPNNPKQISAIRFTVHGACFLGGIDQELQAIQEFESRVKQNPVLVSGSGTAQLDQIAAASMSQQVPGSEDSLYRTFQLNCQPGGKL